MKHYETLGLAKDATAFQIKQAFRKLVRQYHPDVSQAPDAEEKIRAINDAYAILGDEAKRREYDERGEVGNPTEEAEANIRGLALVFFMKALTECPDLSLDILGATKRILQMELDQVLTARSNARAELTKLGSVLHRFQVKAKDKGEGIAENFVQAAIQQRMTNVQTMDEGAAIDEARFRGAIEWLSQYKDVHAMQARPNWNDAKPVFVKSMQWTDVGGDSTTGGY